MLVGDTSDLQKLQYGGEAVLPERDSYQVSLQEGTVSSSFQAGLDRQAIQFLNSPYTATVTYVGLDGFKTAYLENFFNANRGQKFIADLLVGSTEIESFVVQRIGNVSVSKTGFSGSMQVTYQIEPAVDRCFQQVIFDYGQCVGNPSELWHYTDLGVKAWP